MINFQFDSADKFSFHPSVYSNWLKKVIASEQYKTGDILYHFCTDEGLLQINRSFLQHDYYTDIITFPLSGSAEIISGEIFISTERVNENAKTRKIPFQTELARVLVHGVLHLIGYDDHTDEERQQMRAKEDYYLSLLPQK